jgi:hypothetical protein
VRRSWEARLDSGESSYGFLAEAVEVVVAVDAGIMTIGEVKLNGVAADGTPHADHDAGEVFLIGAAVLPSEQISLASIFGAGGPGAQALTGDVMLGAVWPDDGDVGADEFDALGGVHGK